jgi:ketosteroid isomerase-like protein
VSKAEIELIRRQFAGFSRGDFDAATEVLDPEVEWADPAELPGATVHKTPAGVKRFFETFTEAWESWHMEVEAIAEARPNTYLATVRFVGRGKGSGVEGDVVFWSVWHFRDGTPRRIENFMDPGDAKRATAITSPGDEP